MNGRGEHARNVLRGRFGDDLLEAATGGPAASAVMLAAAVTSSAVRVPPAEVPTAAVEALRRMPAASHVEAARTTATNGLGSVPATKQMEATRVRWFSG
jgi:hypothetical protein